MSEEKYSKDYAPISNYSRDDIQQRAEEATKGLVDTSQQTLSFMQERASQTADALSSKAGSLRQATEMAIDKGRDALQNPRDYTQSIYGSICGSARYAWDNFPPLHWLGYGVAALNVVPVTILIGFLICTLVFVLTVSGTGVLLAEGFFLGIGLLFLIPTLMILTFSAISTGFFTIFGWSVYKGVTNLLHKLGLLGREIQFDTSHAAKGARRGYDRKMQEKEY
jgi:hypothetical protein